jgi:multidrug resistance efflux pump
MLEFLLCSLVTILPDYLIRRHFQGKRWGQEITFFSMWYELRLGITACLLLTVALITLVFYYHPSTTNASPFFRTVTILPEESGRVDEVFVHNLQEVNAGDSLFTIRDDTQLAAVNTAKSRVAEVEADFELARATLTEAVGMVDQAKGLLAQAEDDLRMKQEVQSRGANLVSKREVQSLENLVDAREGSLAAAKASQKAAEVEISNVLPSEKMSALQALEQAQVELRKTTVYAGISGRVQQFLLQPGDYVSSVMRPAGLLIPTGLSLESGRQVVQAGFSQLAAPVIKPGTLAEISCLSKPFTVVPMVVTSVTDVIAAGQLRPTDSLIDVQDRDRPGTLAVFMEPLYEGGLDGILPGTKCIANAYSYHHELLASGELDTMESLFLHVVDAVGVVHAIILRIQTLMMPVQMLVFAGH